MDDVHRNDAPVWRIHVVVYAIGRNRMEAIIILNCASEEDIGKKTSIRLTNEENEWVEEVVIKPLPDCPDVPDTISNDVAYIIGWNDCIVEISKERKEAKSLIKNEKESVSNANGTSIK